MGELFNKLCKGPVVVVDDKIGEAQQIDQLISYIESADFPVLAYKSVSEARKKLKHILFFNFIVLDWKMLERAPDIQDGVTLGEAAETFNEQDVIEFIQELQRTCIAPIFIISAVGTDEIKHKLDNAGIDINNAVFVEHKDKVCGEESALFDKIEEWIQASPHIYLTKCWTNEWLLRNNDVFWDLLNVNPNWPVIFYHSFVKEEDPVLALRDTLFQLIFSQIDVSELDHTFLEREIVEQDEALHIESLKNLYRRLVYITKDIDKDIRPGDIFKKQRAYYLNIRPECDTTRRADKQEIYLIKGRPRTPDKVRYEEPFGIIDKETEITLCLLDGHDFVVFNKRDLRIADYSEWKNYKKYRVATPFTTRIRQSYSSYIGRFGVPSYPQPFLDKIFKTEGATRVD